MTKVLHVRSTTGFYGAEKVISNLLPEIERQTTDFSVGLFVIGSEGPDSKRLGAALADQGVDVFSDTTSKKIDWKLIKRLRRLIKNSGYFLLHTHDYKSLVHSRLAAIGTEAKVIHHMHGGLNTTRAEKIYSYIEQFFLNFTVLVFIVSRGIVVNPFKKPLFGIHFLANGVVLPDSAEGSREAVCANILMVARISSEKNHQLAIEAVKILQDRQVPIFLNIVGDGPLIKKVKEYVHATGIDDSVGFCGYINNPEIYYKKADLLIITSKTEGLPMNLLEALSYGVPAVSTAVGEVPKVLESGECGLIARDDPIDFADKIEGLLSDKNQIEKMRINAVKTIKRNYSVSAQSLQVIDQYRKILMHYRKSVLGN